jgi:uncharacterized protein YgiM (DUF1202 family)
MPTIQGYDSRNPKDVASMIARVFRKPTDKEMNAKKEPNTDHQAPSVVKESAKEAVKTKDSIVTQVKETITGFGKKKK